MTIPRKALVAALEHASKRAPVTMLLGPRQCGKTTLAREFASRKKHTWFDLEDPETPLQTGTAKQVLSPLRGLVVIDEFQRQPDLFPLLRVLADRRPTRARFLILGSASLDIVRGASESLAGRVATCEIGGFDIAEIDARRRSQLWIRGGFPRSFLASSANASYQWRSDFVRTFLERDIPQLGFRIPAVALRRFWTMLAHYHGNVWNAAELARSVGSGEAAVRNHLDVFTGAYMVRQLPPWFQNVGKRLVKAPKIYLRDTGILHLLLGLRTRLDVQSHPKLGASWEGFALDQIVRRLDAEREAYFYATHGGAELDLLIHRGSRRFGFEFKYADRLTATRSMRVALEDLSLKHLFVVHPGIASHALDDRISTLPLERLDEVRRKWRW